MIYSCILLIVCLIPFQQKEFDRLAPATLEKPASYSIEVPEFLTDKDIVENPEQVLKLLKDQQQKAFEELKTVKGKGWHSFVGKKDKESTLCLLKFSLSKNPGQKKELVYQSKKAMDDHKAGNRVDLEGLNFDSEDEFYCLTGKIGTPEMVVRAMFLTYVKGELHEMISVHKPDYNDQRTAFDYTRMHFGFDLSPAEFYDKELPKMSKGKSKLVVKKKEDLVELEFWYSTIPDKPTEILLFDLSKNGKAVSTYRIGENVVTEFEEEGEVWLPKLVKRTTSEDYSETRFFDWKVNEVFDKQEFSIKSLPADGRSTVVDKRTGVNVNTKFMDLED